MAFKESDECVDAPHVHGRHDGEASIGASDGLALQLHRSFRVITRLIALTLVVTVVVFGSILFVFQPRVHGYVEGGEATAREYESMLDQETGLRGFLLTRDAAFLAPYRQGRAQLDVNSREMVRRLAFDPHLNNALIAVRVAEA